MYKFLCLIRLGLVFIPQMGYIHPDEHFQGPEVVYGDILNLKTNLTWEFTTKFPVRNIFFPFTVIGIPAVLQKLFYIDYFHGTAFYPYLLLIIPRLALCCISFAHDILIGKICELVDFNYKKSIFLFQSSYVTLVFLTRTFSNTLEALFFTFAIYILTKAKFSKSMDIESRKRLNTKFCYLSFITGFIFMMGFFNRPSFLTYAGMPVSLFVSHILLSICSYRNKAFYFVSFTLGLLSMFVSLAAIDTMYYNKAHYSTTLKLLNNIVLTPVNFVNYNADQDNLTSHGRHPHWLHFCVHTPLLFSFCGAWCIFEFMRHITDIRRLGIYQVVLLVFIIPLLVMSCIPHQEPRFIVPLIIPVIFLFGVSYPMNYRLIRQIWYAHNIVGVLFFGFFHQGGVYQSLSHIHTELFSQPSTAVVFYKTYMPPGYLLGIDKNDPDRRLYDFAGKDIETLQFGIQKMKEAFNPNIIYMNAPFGVANSTLFSKLLGSEYNLVDITYHGPHLSTENLPDFNSVVDVLLMCPLLEKWQKLKMMFSLNVFKFKAISYD